MNFSFIHPLIPPTIRCAFATPESTDSSGIYLKKTETFPGQSEKNRKLLAKLWDQEDLLILHQVHGARVIQASFKDLNPDLLPMADGAMTTVPGLILTIQSADCVPVLLFSENARGIAVAHCGWRSARQGLIAHVVEALKTATSGELRAVIGPSIQQDSYEVGEEFYQDFLAQGSENAKFFKKTSSPKYFSDREVYRFDLPGYVQKDLRKCGITSVINTGQDTFSNVRYPSYRRAQKEGSQLNVRMLSMIQIKA